MRVTDRWPTYTEFGLEFVEHFSRTATGSDDQIKNALLEADRRESPIVECIRDVCDFCSETFDEFEAMGGFDGIVLSQWIKRFPTDEALFKYWVIDCDGKTYFRPAA